MFKHALVQDAAYSTLLRGQREEIHARIAGVIEERFPELSASQPEILAYHAGEAGFQLKAAHYWQQAGQIAASRSANAEASAHLMRGIQMLAGVAETPERDRQELTLQLGLGPALMSNRGYHVPGAQAAYQRARKLAERLGDDQGRFAAIWGMWLSGAATGEERYLLLDDMFQAARKLGDDALLLQAHHSAWATRIWRGELVVCHDHVRKGLSLYDQDRHRNHALLYGGHDPAVCGKGQGGVLQWLLGYPDQAVQSGQEGITLAEGLGHLPSLAHSLWFAGCIHLLRRDVSSVPDCGERLLVLGGEHGLGFYQSIGGILRGWSLIQLGNTAEGLTEMRRAVDAYGASGPTMIRFFHAILAEAELSAGNHDRAAAVLSDPRLSGLTEVFWQSVRLCIQAGILLTKSRDNWEAAKRLHYDAIAVAREQQAKSLELRAGISLARLLCREGDHTEARDLLAPIYGWFTEGFETPDLKDAKALLEELG